MFFPVFIFPAAASSILSSHSESLRQAEILRQEQKKKEKEKNEKAKKDKK